MIWLDEIESHHTQRKLAMEAFDDLMEVKIQLLDAGKPVPAFVNNALTYLKRKYMTEEKTISQMFYKRIEVKTPTFY